MLELCNNWYPGILTHHFLLNNWHPGILTHHFLLNNWYPGILTHHFLLNNWYPGILTHHFLLNNWYHGILTHHFLLNNWYPGILTHHFLLKMPHIVASWSLAHLVQNNQHITENEYGALSAQHWEEKTQVFRQKPAPVPHVHHKPHMVWPGNKPGTPQGEGLAP